MKLLLSIIYIIALLCGVFVFFNYSFPEIIANPGDLPVPSILATIFLLIFGIYGLFGIKLLNKLKRQNPNSLEIEASYYIRKKGFIGKIFLFPFIHIKSRHSFVIAFFGSVIWMIILMIIYFGMVVKLL